MLVADPPLEVLNVIPTDPLADAVPRLGTVGRMMPIAQTVVKVAA